MVDSCGRCCQDIEVHNDSTDKLWKCSSKCKPLTECEVNTIFDFKSDFDRPMCELLPIILACDDGCPNTHYSKVVHETDDCGETDVPRKGHTLLCFVDSNCKSKLRISRSASAHYPTLRSFLHAVYVTRNSHLTILKLEQTLLNGDISALIDASSVSFDDLFSIVEEHVQDISNLEKPDLEMRLHVHNAEVLAYYQSMTVLRMCVVVVSSCIRKKILRWSGLTTTWEQQCGVSLKDYLLKQDASAADDMHFMCNYCKPLIRRDKMPARCVLNGLHVVEVPPEFSRLDCLSKQFIQLAKAYQTVVQLGTYTAKVPTYNSLKTCKGSMLFLPLPLDKTLQTLEEVGENTTLASPELYIIVNGRPTKSKVVWRILVDVNHIKAAVSKLRKINGLYKHIHEDSADEAVSEVVEVVKNTTSTMLQKATKEDIADMQCYTIRSLNSKQFTGGDMEQYKLVNAYMHLRLEELFGRHDWFGGRNVLFVGDLLQLQPVNGSPVFEKISKKSLCLKLGCAASISIWTGSVVYDELTINERQKKDDNFSIMLGCVR